MDSRGDPGGGYRAILFVDLVESCALKARLGEQRYFEEVESRYLETVRRALDVVPCRERNDTGDGKLLTFDRVEDAVTAALMIQGHLRSAVWKSERPQVRIGIHGGSTRILPGGEIRGNNVDLCARLTSLALPGQILLTRHAYDEARRFLRSHPPLEGQASPPELAFRTYGSYPFKGFADRCEVCEIGARDEAPLEAPALPSAAGTADKALKLVENLGRFVRRNPLSSSVGAVAFVAIVAVAANYVWNSTQRLPAGTTLPGRGSPAEKIVDEFDKIDSEAWFSQIVRRYVHDMEEQKVRFAHTDVAVFIGEPLPYSQNSLEFRSDQYRGFEVRATALLVRDDGWIKVLDPSQDFVISDGVMTFRIPDVQRGAHLRIIVSVASTLATLPEAGALRFDVL
jgi:class 3 adenylate cyclase